MATDTNTPDPHVHIVSEFGFCEFTDNQLRAVIQRFGSMNLSEMAEHYLYRTGVQIPLNASLFDVLAMLADIEVQPGCPNPQCDLADALHDGPCLKV